MRSSKIVALMLSVVMAASAMIGSAIPAFAAKTDNKKVSAARIWNGKTGKEADISWFDGKKTEYNISTPEQLAGLAYLTDYEFSYFDGVTINLTNDIILNDTTNWENWEKKPPKNVWNPIGSVLTQVGDDATNKFHPFCGVFNGNGHTISGMYVRTHDEAGLFSAINNAVVMDLNIEKSVVISDIRDVRFSIARGVAGMISGRADKCYIQNCSVSDGIVKSYGGKGTGGLVGQIENATNYGQVLFMMLMGFGIGFNPVFFFAGEDGKKEQREGTFFENCISDNIKLSASNVNTDMVVGGMLGYAKQDFGMYNCVASNCGFHSVGEYGWGGGYGRLYGSSNFFGSEAQKIIKNCYAYNCERTDGMDVNACADKDFVKTISKKTATSSDFAKKLGKNFRAVKNGLPELKCINKYPVKIVLSGEKAAIRWTKINGAKKYIVYSKGSDGKYKVLSTVTTTITTLKNIKKGKSYDLMIRAQLSDGSYKDIGGKFTLKA